MRYKFLRGTTYHSSLFFYLFCNCCSLNTTIDTSGCRIWWIFLLLKCRLLIISTGATSITLGAATCCGSKSFEGFVEAWATNYFVLLLWLLLLCLGLLAWHVWRMGWVQRWSIWRWTIFSKWSVIIPRRFVPKNMIYKWLFFTSRHWPHNRCITTIIPWQTAYYVILIDIRRLHCNLLLERNDHLPLFYI